MLLFFFSMIYKTFEAKIHHLETRLSRKPREGTAELEYFVRCEVHSSDLNTFISSIKRVAEDVRTTKEDKCKKKKLFGFFVWLVLVVVVWLRQKLGKDFNIHRKGEVIPDAECDQERRLPQGHLFSHFFTKSHTHPLLPQSASLLLSPHSSLVSQKNMWTGQVSPFGHKVWPWLRLGSPGECMGTYLHLSPEQVLRNKELENSYWCSWIRNCTGTTSCSRQQRTLSG